MVDFMQPVPVNCRDLCERVAGRSPGHCGTNIALSV